MSPEELFRAVRNNQLDVILTIDHLILSMDHVYDKFGGILEKRVMKVRRLLCYSREHDLSEKKDLRITDYADETFYIFKEQERSVRELLDKEFAVVGKLPEIVVLDKVESTITTAECGMGVAIVNEWHKAVQNGSLQTVEIGDPYSISLVMKEDSDNEQAGVFMNELYMLLKDSRQKRTV